MRYVGDRVGGRRRKGQCRLGSESSQHNTSCSTRGSTAAPGTTSLADGLPDTADRWSPELGSKAMPAGLRRANGGGGEGGSWATDAGRLSVQSAGSSCLKLRSNRIMCGGPIQRAMLGRGDCQPCTERSAALANSTHAVGLAGGGWERVGGWFEDRMATCARAERQASSSRNRFLQAASPVEGSTRSGRSVAREGEGGRGNRSTLA